MATHKARSASRVNPQTVNYYTIFKRCGIEIKNWEHKLCGRTPPSTRVREGPPDRARLLRSAHARFAFWISTVISVTRFVSNITFEFDFWLYTNFCVSDVLCSNFGFNFFILYFLIFLWLWLWLCTAESWFNVYLYFAFRIYFLLL